MRRMACSPINGSHGLLVSCCRVTEACQNTEPHNLCQETSFHIFFRSVIHDADPAPACFRQFLHFIGIRWADPWLVLRALLRPANKRTFHAQTQDLGGRGTPLVLGASRYPLHLRPALWPTKCRNSGKQRCHSVARNATTHPLHPSP